MQVKHLYIALAILALLVMSCFAGAVYYMGGVLARQDQFRQDMKAELQRVSQDFSKRMDELAGERKQVEKSPEAAASVINRYFELKQPAQIVKPADAPSYLAVPQSSIQPMAQAVLACEECKAKLNKCETELGLQTRRAELAERNLKGGSFITRLKNNAKFITIGIGAGAALGYAAHGR